MITNLLMLTDFNTKTCKHQLIENAFCQPMDSTQ